MTDDQQRTAAVRDVPPPRPVAGGSSAATPAEEGPLGRAGRVLADAVSGLLGGGTGREGDAAPSGNGRWSPSSTLRDVVSAVAAVAGNRGGRATPPGGASTGDPGPGKAPGAIFGDLLTAAAPRLPIRDARRLREAHPGATDDEIADALIARAARLTSGVGAATGGFSATSWVAPASLLTLPVGLAAETVLTAAVEVVLVGELHELYGRPAAGDARARALAYLASWSGQRAVDDSVAPGLGVLLGGAGLRALRHRTTRRLARSLPRAAPFAVGAALGGRGNRRATESLARRVLDDLRGPRP